MLKKVLLSVLSFLLLVTSVYSQCYQKEFLERNNEGLLIVSTNLFQQVENGYIYGEYKIEPYKDKAKNHNQKAIRLIDISLYRLYFEHRFAKNSSQVFNAWARHQKEVGKVIGYYTKIDSEFLKKWIHDYEKLLTELVIRLDKERNKKIARKILETLDVGVSLEHELTAGTGLASGPYIEYSVSAGGHLSTNLGLLIKVLDNTNYNEKVSDLIIKLEALKKIFPNYARRCDYISDIEYIIKINVEE